jgi:flagellar basal-body rod protein FlgB
MDFTNVPLFSVMKAKLNYLSAEQATLAQNVANADVPAYKARDAVAPDFKKMAFSGSSARVSGGVLPMQTTNAKHIAVLSAPAVGAGGTIIRASTFERNPSGNNVAIEEEMAKIADNQAEYQKVLNLYRKTVDMFKTAIGKTGG